MSIDFPKKEHNDSNPATADTEEIHVDRRTIVAATIAGLGSVTGLATFIGRLQDKTDRSCENIPVPTGHYAYDVYGNRTDSNELLRQDYDTAVHNEECRQEKNGE